MAIESRMAHAALGLIFATTLPSTFAAGANHQGRPSQVAWQAPVAVAQTSPQSSRTVSSSRKSTPKRERKPQVGKASYYSKRFQGRRTASGHPYHQDAYTAAHRTLPLGTWVRVTNLGNQRWVVVQITDRGPYAGSSRIIDLSRRSADELAMTESGLAKVRLEVMEENPPPMFGEPSWDSPFASL